MMMPCYSCYEYRECTKDPDGKYRCAKCSIGKEPTDFMNIFKGVFDASPQ